jgi:hypothetical protein
MFVRSVGRSALFAFALFVLLAGCSGKQTAQVSGMVRVDGQPLDKGSISFIPADGKGSTAGGDIKEGKYLVPKVSVGLMKVQIRYPRVTGKKKLYDTPDSPTRDVYTEVLPKKYNDNTELELDVQPGKKEKDWDLSTR